MIASIITLVIGLLFLVMGIVLFCGKGSWLIAGYNTMSPQEKEKYDEKKLCKAASLVCVLCSLMLFIMSYLGYRVERQITSERDMLIFVIAFIAVITVAIFAALIYMNTKAKKK